ncbi:MAG: SIR2 family protein [Patescibacteria group bacterium]
MKKINKKELKEIIQSGHLNLLIGSGCSLDYLSTLKDIEDKMNVETTREVAQKNYYKLIRKSKAILNNTLESDVAEKTKLTTTKQNYDSFLSFWADKVSKRSLHIVNKQVNIFTTNFDMFMESSCEKLGIPYNDGFSGQINPIFNVANFNKIQKYKSLQFDNTSDIPLFNIIKLHGSISWAAKGEKISYSNGSHITDDLDGKTGENFSKEYKQIAVINPNAEKHFETVLDTNYASMLRKFTLELEKENSVLMIFGFSLADKHIKNLLYGVMKSNPTLVVIYFSYSQYDETLDKLEEKKNSNLYVVSPEADFSFEKSIKYLVDAFNGNGTSTQYEENNEE